MILKKSYIIIIIIFIIIFVYLIVYPTIKKYNTNNRIVFVGNDIEKSENLINKTIQTYDDYKNIFKSNELTEEDFKDNNYILIKINYNSCSEEDVEIKEYEANEKKVNIVVTYRKECGLCARMTDYYLLKVNKNIIDPVINIDYKATNKKKCDTTISYKPLIYLYPKEKTNITIKLGKPDLLTSTYPKYNNGWNVYASPNGELKDKTGRTYYGLYWEGKNEFKTNYEDGFIVEKEEIIPFLESKLSILGLNEREANEFIIYWLPKLEENKYNLIRFESIEKINEQMPLEINPKPDKIIRVFMKYKPIDQKLNIKNQELKQITRTDGFNVIEWGGSLIK